MNNKTYVKEVAETIRAQLNCNITEVWAWGSKDFYYLEREHNGVKYPALMFSVRTPKIKKGGRVIITYNDGADEYIVEAVRVVNGKEIPVGKREGIYFDQLHQVINSLIEDKETYTKVFF